MKENLGFRPEVDRMKGLLVDAITTLCRNGLRYKAGLRVEGLIGITLDEEDIILVNVNKTFIAEGCRKNTSKASSDEESADDQLDSSPKKSYIASKSSRGIKREASPQSYSVTKRLKQSVASESTGSDAEASADVAEVEPGEVTQARVRVENTSWVPQQSHQHSQHTQNSQACFPQALTVHTEEGSESVPVKIELTDEEDNGTDEMSNYGATLLQNFSQSGSTISSSQPFDPQNTSDVLFTQPSLGGSQSLPDFSTSSPDDMHLQGSGNFQMAGVPQSLSQKVKVLPVVSGGRRCFKCKACNLVCATPEHMQNHLAVNHPGGFSVPRLWNCRQCSYTSPRKGNLVRHLKLVHKTVVPYRSISSGVYYQEHMQHSDQSSLVDHDVDLDSGTSDAEVVNSEKPQTVELGGSGRGGSVGYVVEPKTGEVD